MSRGEDFADYMKSYLEEGHDGEAIRLVMDAVEHGDYLGDAVALVIESLPARKTARMREVVALYEPWLRWQEAKGMGFKIQGWARGQVRLQSPRKVEYEDVKDVFDDFDMVAVAAGVLRVRPYSDARGSHYDPYLERIYTITKE